MTHVFWDITARCNACCRYCSAAESMGRTEWTEPNLELVVATLDHLKTAGVDSIILLGGEPTLRVDLAEIIGEALKRGLRVGIATNGLAMAEPLRRALQESSDLSVNFSLDSFFAEENDAVRGSGYYAACVRNLKVLLAERKSSGSQVKITMQVTLTVNNFERLGESLLRLCDLGVDSILIDRMRSWPWQSSEIKALALKPREWIIATGRVARAAMRLSDPSRLRVNFGHARLKAALTERYGYPIYPAQFCPAGLEAAVIDFSGNIHPCRMAVERPVPVRADGTPYYEIRPFNIRSPEAGKFMRSAYMVDFYNFAHSARVYEGLTLCRDCPHYENCDPCPLDVVTFGDRVLAECRAIEEGCEP
ncbi:MAG: radical SAM protein [Candidatus Eisenbacteria sp.]|nr:radical SAM protein [Candidatus Eisenbacteria bacterium]